MHLAELRNQPVRLHRITSVSYTHLDVYKRQALLSAIPVPDPDVQMERIILKGELSSPIEPEAGCRFAKRCIYATESCTGEDIPLTEYEHEHFVACVRIHEIND